MLERRAIVVLALSAWPAVVHAKEPLKLEYVDAAGCETSRGFSDAVLSLTRLARAAGPGELARTFRVSLRPSGGGVVGEVSGAAPGGATLRLSAHGNCEQVLGALSFGIAFTLDPSAHLVPEAEVLPENPYWSRLAALPPEPPLPDNPYRPRVAGVQRVETDPLGSAPLPSNPYR